MSTITTWNAAVASSPSSDTFSAQMPRALDSSCASTLSAASWPCGFSRLRRQRPPALHPPIVIGYSTYLVSDIAVTIP
ncbi:MAG: hypothetical protein WKH68_03200 [Candidatus Limnocylindria bacterium]